MNMTKPIAFFAIFFNSSSSNPWGSSLGKLAGITVFSTSVDGFVPVIEINMSGFTTLKKTWSALCPLEMNSGVVKFNLSRMCDFYQSSKEAWNSKCFLFSSSELIVRKT